MILCFQRKMLVFYTTLLFNCVLVSSIADASDNNFNIFFQDALTIKKFRYSLKYSEEKCLQNGMFFLISRFHSLTHTHTQASHCCISRRCCFPHLFAVPLLNLPQSQRCFLAQQMENNFTCVQTPCLRSNLPPSNLIFTARAHQQAAETQP